MSREATDQKHLLEQQRVLLDRLVVEFELLGDLGQPDPPACREA
jgi:hypothetical protein